jgi:membrane protease YdiL (CAAX protease family)
VWGGAIALAVAVTARTAAEEVGPWRLLVLALVFGLLAGIWDRALKLPVPGGTRLGFSFLAAVVLAIFALRVVRPLATLDLRLAVSRGAHGTALGAVLALVAVAAPLGWLADYVAWNPRPGPAVAAVERFASLVVFVAIPEELLFRGLIQEALTRLRGPRVGLVGASLLFGLTHIGKATGLAPEQINALGLNWRYALLAAFAGLAYGWVYQRTGKIAAAALTHGAVNWIWSSFLLR